MKFLNNIKKINKYIHTYFVYLNIGSPMIVKGEVKGKRFDFELTNK